MVSESSNSKLKIWYQGTQSHSKVKHIKYKKLESQHYLSSSLFTNYEVELLNKIRSRNLDLKANFKTKFTFNNISHLKCSLNGCSQIEEQSHILECIPIWQKFNEKYKLMQAANYSDIFSKNIKKQKRITKLYTILLDIRENLLKKEK